MKVSGKHFTLVISILLMIIFSSACGPRQASLVPQPEPSLTPTEPPLPTASATSAPTATATPEPIYLRVDADLPAAFEQSLKLEGTDFQRVSSGKTSAVLDYGRGNPISTWIYALAAPFPTVTNTIPAKTFLGFWQRAEAAPFTRLILDAETLKALQSRLGAPVGDVEVLDADRLLLAAWTTENTWAVIPFEQIQPRWKVIALDGQSPLHKDFEQQKYPLVVPISLTASQGAQSAALAERLQPFLAQSNRDPDKLVTVILTGVTAMVRGTASEMEEKGITRGAEVIGPVTREADILHISNEVPFAVDCKDPVPKLSGKLSFCSKDSYLELLEAVGTDVVELTGDHFQDWGEAALEHTLELYRQNGLPYYGGGLNIEEARQPVKLEIKGTKIAFLGCNAKPTIYGNATAEKGGNFRCDWEYMTAEVKSLRAEGYLPIVTFQHLELVFPSKAVRMLDDGMIYVMYDTESDGRVFIFFSEEKTRYAFVDGYPVLMKKTLSYEDFESLAVGDGIEQVQEIDPIVLKYGERLDTLNDTALANYRVRGRLPTSVHLLTDGILKIEYERDPELGYAITDIIYSQDFVLDGFNGETCYRIVDADYVD